jgi:hypothetical protein
MHLYKKKLCDEAIIVPTIFCWLNDWVAKEFANFLKVKIAELGKVWKGEVKGKRRE